MNPTFSESTLSKINRLLSRYPADKRKSALLPLLHMAQAEFGGYLSPETMDYVAQLLTLRPIEVYEVASFYTMFHKQPTGKYVLEVCRTGPCALNGAESIIDYITRKIGVTINEISSDGLFTVKEVECLASCGTAPMMQLGERYIENLTEQKIDDIIDRLKHGERLDIEPNPENSILFRSCQGQSNG